eukprot:CAMPEP_0194273812 /NCGR_PEP_ID=MMETSP0169-20130528/7072_1 /TAXON_ID=218684 /ORGANISM="Corethron pennatum, Strain L29A3" /LENGTH=181 /DNA_ID=CAMNT_0039016877 /DNA_START=32 /DNA_END=577 /DNA_ORIENTATION=-
MKGFASALVSLLALSRCYGFSIVSRGEKTVHNVHSVPLFASPDGSGVDGTNVELHRRLPSQVAGFVAAAAMGWSLAAGAGLASAPSSILVAYNEKDFADFSLPTYQKALSSAINENIKGDTILIEQPKSESTAMADSAPAPSKADLKKAEDDEKAAKAAAKAASKAARDKQKADAEAALGA